MRIGSAGTSEISTCTETISSTSRASISCNVDQTVYSSNENASRRSVETAFSKHSWRSSSLHYPTIKCGKASMDCSVQNVYGEWPDRRKCLAARAVFPTNEEELVAAVAGAVRRRQSIKVATATGHSMPQWACARGSKGLIISTQNLNRRIDVDQSTMRVSVDSGVQVRELVDTLARAGLALPHSPYWDAITLGGLLSTGSHGSSLFGKGAAVQEYVVAMRLVVPAPPDQGYAQVLQLSPQDPLLLKAARVALGLLGVISQVTLEVEPQFKRAVEKEIERDDNLEEVVGRVGRAYEFGDLTWLPSMHKVVLNKEGRVPLHTPGHQINAFVPFLPTHFLVRSTLRLLEEVAERSVASKCAIAAFLSSALLRHGPSWKLLKKERGPLIGYNHQMQASGSCASSEDPNWACPWARPGSLGYFYHETSFTLPLENVTLFLQDIKKLREVARPTSLCGIDYYAGILLRFIKRSTAYLGHQTDGVSMDITYYRSHQAHMPRLDEDIYEEIEQMALFKYGGWPHWGKNRPLAFADLPSKYPNMDKFLLAKDILDPEGLFSSEWSDSVLGIKGNVTSNDDYCALEGLCVCREDRHCAPERGYLCQPGRIYKEARVCSSRNGTDSYIVKLLYPILISWIQTCISSTITLASDLIIYVHYFFS